MKVLVNGCSHSTGDYFYNQKILQNHSAIRKTWWNFLTKTMKMDAKNIHQCYYFQLKECPEVVARRRIHSPYKIEILNTIDSVLKYLDNDVDSLINKDEFLLSLANDGKGNDVIFFETFDVLRRIKKNKINLDFVVIQWSSPFRKLVSNEKNEYLYSNPHEHFEYGLHFDPAGSMLTLNYMLILQDYFKQNNIKYVFLNYFPLHKKIENSFLYKDLDLQKIVKFDENSHPLFDGWVDSILDNKLNCDEQGHANLEGFEYIADRIINVLNKEYDLNLTKKIL